MTVDVSLGVALVAAAAAVIVALIRRDAAMQSARTMARADVDVARITFDRDLPAVGYLDATTDVEQLHVTIAELSRGQNELLSEIDVLNARVAQSVLSADVALVTVTGDLLVAPPVTTDYSEANNLPIPELLESTDGHADDSVKDEFCKIPRNATCPCGSGRKFKTCHGR